MRSPFQLPSLRSKVVLVTVLTSAIALALATGAFVLYDLSTFRDRVLDHLSAQGDVLAESSKAALVFGDRDAAQEKLAALSADPEIVEAGLFGHDGALFARYAEAGSKFEPPQLVPGLDHVIEDAHIDVFRPVTFEKKRIGTIYLRSDLHTLEQHRRGFRIVVASVFAVAMLLALALAYRFQKVVSGPVARLADAARRVAESRDLRIQVPVTSEDELGVLSGAFNRMLGKLEERDEALRGSLARLRESEERYALAASGSNDGIWDWDLAADQVFYSQRWKEMLGWRDDEISSRPSEWLDRIHPDDAQHVRGQLDAHLAGFSDHFECEYRIAHRSGSYLWVFSRGLAVRDTFGHPYRIAGSQSDVTDRKGRDALTGLPNRLLFVDRLEALLRRGGSPDDRRFAVLGLDLERLSLVNETLGRTAGRELLLEAADRIRAVLRPRDTLARLDFGQFAILLEKVDDIAHASRVAERIHAALAPPFQVGGKEVLTSAAIGISLGASGYENSENAIRDAETAMERARNLGWKRSEVFDPAMRDQAFARLELENDLRRALERDELELHYQPIVAVAGGALLGFEALVRWRRAPGRLATPAEFIALAEQTGLVVPLGSWVLRQACFQLREWRSTLPGAERLAVSVNVAGSQLVRTELLDEVAAALSDSGLDAASLKLEITESSVVDHLGPASAVLREIERMGVGLWLDDFGTGYSSLSYLHRLPIQAMKIDRSFVSGLGDGNGAGALIRTIVLLARHLGLRTIAEGVEEPGQSQRLRALGCEFVQGHLISYPLDAASAGQMIAAAAAPTTSET